MLRSGGDDGPQDDGVALSLLTHGAPAIKDEPALEPQSDLAPPVAFAGWTGWRMKSDVFTLRWDQVDFEAGTVTRWSRGTSKAPRGIAVEYVFHRNGKPIHDFYAAWRAACKRAKVAGRVPHDLRRTAARRMRALGMSDRDIAELCGWETIEMVTRYLGRDPAGVADRLRLRLAEAAARARAGSRSGG